MKSKLVSNQPFLSGVIFAAGLLLLASGSIRAQLISTGTSSTTNYYIGGRVGIGYTTAPTGFTGQIQLPSIVGATSDNRQIVLNGVSPSMYQFAGMGYNSTNSALGYFVPTTTNDHVFFAGSTAFFPNNVELVRIKGNGSVGIGVSTITERLTVGGNGRFNQLLVGTIGGSGGFPMISFNSDFNYAVYTPNSFQAQIFYDPSKGKFHIRTSSTSTSTSITDSQFNYPIIITANGNTAIGNGVAITDPTAKLHVFGDAIIADRLAIGTTFPTNLNCNPNTTQPLKLLVNGIVGAKEFRCHMTQWCDYVFEPTYNLKPLAEVERFIKANKHLPGVPSEKEMTDKGMAVGEMMQTQMKKIEELTLYVIELKKEIDHLKK